MGSGRAAGSASRLPCMGEDTDEFLESTKACVCGCDAGEERKHRVLLPIGGRGDPASSKM